MRRETHKSETGCASSRLYDAWAVARVGERRRGEPREWSFCRADPDAEARNCFHSFADLRSALRKAIAKALREEATRVKLLPYVGGGGSFPASANVDCRPIAHMFGTTSLFSLVLELLERVQHRSRPADILIHQTFVAEYTSLKDASLDLLMGAAESIPAITMGAATNQGGANVTPCGNGGAPVPAMSIYLAALDRSHPLILSSLPNPRALALMIADQGKARSVATVEQLLESFVRSAAIDAAREEEGRPEPKPQSTAMVAWRQLRRDAGEKDRELSGRNVKSLGGAINLVLVDDKDSRSSSSSSSSQKRALPSTAADSSHQPSAKKQRKKQNKRDLISFDTLAAAEDWLVHVGRAWAVPRLAPYHGQPLYSTLINIINLHILAKTSTPSHKLVNFFDFAIASRDGCPFLGNVSAGPAKDRVMGNQLQLSGVAILDGEVTSVSEKLSSTPRSGGTCSACVGRRRVAAFSCCGRTRRRSRGGGITTPARRSRSRTSCGLSSRWRTRSKPCTPFVRPSLGLSRYPPAATPSPLLLFLAIPPYVTRYDPEVWRSELTCCPLCERTNERLRLSLPSFPTSSLDLPA